MVCISVAVRLLCSESVFYNLLEVCHNEVVCFYSWNLILGILIVIQQALNCNQMSMRRRFCVI